MVRLREALRAERAERTTVSRDEDERVDRAEGVASRRVHGGPVRARELDQRGDPGRVVVRSGPRAGVVPVRD